MTKRIILFLITAAIAIGNLAAQNSRDEVNAGSGNEKKMETSFIGKTGVTSNPVIKQERVFETTLSVKKTDKNDVATVILKVIGDPFNDGTGVQMILDADAEMIDFFWDHYGDWDYIYDICEYKSRKMQVLILATLK